MVVNKQIKSVLFSSLMLMFLLGCNKDAEEGISKSKGSFTYNGETYPVENIKYHKSTYYNLQGTQRYYFYLLGKGLEWNDFYGDIEGNGSFIYFQLLSKDTTNIASGAYTHEWPAGAGMFPDFSMDIYNFLSADCTASGASYSCIESYEINGGSVLIDGTPGGEYTIKLDLLADSIPLTGEIVTKLVME